MHDSPGCWGIKAPRSPLLVVSYQLQGVTMPLMRTGQAAIDTPEDIFFLMQDGKRVVRIDVQRRLLKDLAGLPAAELATLEEHRRSIEQIANAKYEDGDYLRCANSCVITIKKDDWIRHPHTAPRDQLALSLSAWSRQKKASGQPLPKNQGHEAHQEDDNRHARVGAKLIPIAHDAEPLIRSQ